jgi:hypothetical protein
MTIKQFVDKWIGKELDWDNFYGGQCVDLFRYYCDEVLQIKQPAGVWGAANFWTNFDTDPVLRDNFTKISNTADFVPLEGDVAVWNFNAGGGFGHIAIVIGNDHTKSYFHSFDQNWSRVSYCEIVKHTYTNFYGVLRPKQIPEGELMEIEKELFEKLVNKSTKYDEFVSMGYDNPDQVKDEIEELEKKTKNYEAKIKELNRDIFLLQEDIAELNSELENCNTQIPGEEDLQENYEITGRKIIKTVGDTVIETSFKRKA